MPSWHPNVSLVPRREYNLLAEISQDGGSLDSFLCGGQRGLERLCDIVKGIFDCCAIDFLAFFRYILSVETISAEEDTTSDPVPASQRTSAEMENFFVNWMTEAGWPQGLSVLLEKTAKVKIDFTLDSLPDDHGLGRLKRS